MESPIPDLQEYINIAKIKGISEETIKMELMNLMKKTNSYIKAMNILIERIKGEKIIQKVDVEGTISLD